jgi:hypothetical protein
MKVKLWNDNAYDFTQTYRDKKYLIPAKEYIELEEDEAHQLCCAYYPPQVDGGGTPKPASYKMLRMENRSSVAPDPFQCVACGYKAMDGKDLKAHTDARLSDGLHKSIEAPGLQPTVTDIISGLSEGDKQELASLLMSSVKKKPGRPKKDVREDIQK